MEGARLYPGIAYFTLTKDLPGCKEGTIIQISDADGREELYAFDTPIDPNDQMQLGVGIRFRINYAIRYPDWFKAVTQEEHLAICKTNTILYYESKGKTRQEAEDFEAKHG